LITNLNSTGDKKFDVDMISSIKVV
jgi:hypothetical protein